MKQPSAEGRDQECDSPGDDLDGGTEPAAGHLVRTGAGDCEELPPLLQSRELLDRIFRELQACRIPHGHRGGR